MTGKIAILNEVLAERGKEYGDFEQMCAVIQSIKTAINDGNTSGLLPHQQEALEMIAVKIGRILTGNPNNVDSWRDIAGYATLVADRLAPIGQLIEIPKGITPMAGGFKVDKTGYIYHNFDTACNQLAKILRGEI